MLGGAVQTTAGTVLGGVPIRLPAVDVHSVSAGGGSIAWIDEGGALRVGPRSAGADPGPACYGHGGDQATVTDANLVLGHLADGGRLGDNVILDRSRALAALTEPLYEPIRRVLPTMGGLDFSPMIVLLGLQFVRSAIAHSFG